MNKRYAFWFLLWGGIALLAAILPMILNGNVRPSGLVVAILVAVIIPPILMWIAEKMGYPLGRAVSCPNCGTEMPLFRHPTSARQAIWGGYTCPKCGTEMDAAGRKLA
jgi:hypothetical protein